MIISEVAKLSPLNRFLYWMRERYSIALRRRAGASKPWTDDEVMRSFFFTHPYREMDKVTIWFKENIREPLRNRSEVLFATICFRWFNLPETGEALGVAKEVKFNYAGVQCSEKRFAPDSLLIKWDPNEALRRLGAIRDRKGQVFTGAFMINSPPGEPKLEAIVRRVNNVWEKRRELLRAFHKDGETDPHIHGCDTRYQGDCTLESAHKALTQFDGMGGFMAYEVVCDLRYTYLLEKAPDKLTWCNPGPGCVRGLYRLLGRDFPKGDNSTSPPCPADFQDQMRDLLRTATARLRGMPALEMREIEHSLCEFDKYERLRNGDGKAKRRYQGA